jgi:hypothetical protein
MEELHATDQERNVTIKCHHFHDGDKQDEPATCTIAATEITIKLLALPRILETPTLNRTSTRGYPD